MNDIIKKLAIAILGNEKSFIFNKIKQLAILNEDEIRSYANSSMGDDKLNKVYNRLDELKKSKTGQ